jgi:alkylation response protein AidB-like acyl-CoA dehydrogenase
VRRAVETAEAALDAVLGDTARQEAALDQREAFPADLCARLDAFGLPAHYVPTRWGGRLDDYGRLWSLWRTVARRDLSAVVAHGKTFLGAAPVWVAGNSSQAEETAAAVLAGAPMAWALSEPEHGADLLRNSFSARPVPGGWRLDGVKWPVNNATRAGRLSVLACTDAAETARGHSLFLVDKAGLAPDSWRALPKEPTHGIRGVDISGIEFSGATVPEDAMIGPRGTGIETTLRCLQLTRTLCTALSAGAGERALRVAARFAAGRLIKERPLAERPVPLSVLARCAALLAAAEASSLVAARSIHSLTGEMSVTSAIVKPLAPTLADSVLGELAELLGVRSFLVGVYEHGAFQKLYRDHQIVSVFDGSTPVNRAALVQQFPRLVAGFESASYDAAGLAEAVGQNVFLRPPCTDSLTLASRTGSSVVQSLPVLAMELAADNGPAGLAEQAAALCADARRLTLLMAQVRPAARPAMMAYEMAAAYELCYAGAACLQVWKAQARQHSTAPLWQGGLWVRAALRELRARLAVTMRWAPPDACPGDDAIGQELGRLTVAAAANGSTITPLGTPVPMISPGSQESV